MGKKRVSKGFQTEWHTSFLFQSEGLAKMANSDTYTKPTNHPCLTNDVRITAYGE